VNKVPLRRVNQAYVIATSTVVDVSKVDAKAATDKLLAAKEERAEKAAALRGKKESAFLELQKESKARDASAERKALQAAIDGAIKLDDITKKYLASRFALSAGQKPHAMKF
jgi:large subunit ribosomal protein L6e